MNTVLSSFSLLSLGAGLALAGCLAAAPAQAGLLRGTRTHAAGGTVQRTGSTSVNADGTATHQGSFSASGARGTAQSSGSASYDPATGLTQNRASSATNAATGNSVQSSSSYSRESGLSRSTTCYNASGATIACR